MATIYPFCGYRYDESKAGAIGSVVTQPYDKISEEMRGRYLEANPYNIVRIIKNTDYQAASDFLRKWSEEGVLRRDEEPSFYVYEQTFTFDGETISRRGFIGLVDLTDSSVTVKGHERVLDQPLADRLKLIRATEANDGLIFTLFSDSELEVDRLLAASSESWEPEYEFEDDLGVRNRLWRLTEKATIESIRQSVSTKALYIADGHHRFTTAVKYYEQAKEKGWRPAAVESFDKRMMALFNMESEGVRILATHRVLKNLEHYDREELLNRLKRHFSVEECSGLEALGRSLVTAPGHAMGLLLADPVQTYLLELEEGALEDEAFMPDVSGPARELDVNLLHEGILKPCLGLGAKELASERYVDYYRDREAMFEALQAGDYQLAFVLNPTPLEQVKMISERGEKMPQKSTDFYPKLLTGLVLMKMEIEK